MAPVFSTVLEAKTQKNKLFERLREDYSQPGMSDHSKPAIKGYSIFAQAGAHKAATLLGKLLEAVLHYREGVKGEEGR